VQRFSEKDHAQIMAKQERAMSLAFSVGDLTIHCIVEQETTFLPAREMLPDLTPELLAGCEMV
jgi:hypothetical protein